MSQATSNPTEARPEMRLAPRQDLAAAAALRDWFLACEGDATLDASEVRLLATPVLQVLLAGSDHVRARGGTLRIDRPSAEFLDGLAELGCDLARLLDGRAGREAA